MRKLALGMALLLASVTIAEAQQRRHYNNNGNRYVTNNYYVKRNNNNWVAPLVGGMVVGGLLYGLSQQPSYAAPTPYYGPAPVYPAYGPRYCQRNIVGYQWNGYRNVPIYQSFCNY